MSQLSKDKYENEVTEIGYDLHPGYQGKGIMSEALKHIIDFSFTTLHFRKIEAHTHSKNKRSRMLLVRNGFNLAEQKFGDNNSSNIIFELVYTKQKPNK